MQIFLLEDDLKQLLTKNISNSSEDIQLEQLAKDHPQALYLVDPNTKQSQRIGSLTIEQLRHIDDYGTQHIFIPPEDLIRLGAFLNLDIYHSLALVLKVSWEKHYAHWQGWPSQSSNLRKLLLNTNNITEAQNHFNPDSRQILELFQQCHSYGYADLDGYDARSWDTLIQEMILNDIHLISQTSHELNLFARTKHKELGILQQATPSERERFWLCKCRWIAVQEELAEQLLFLENRRIEAAQLQKRWLQIFGQEYVALQHQAMELRLCQMRLKLLEMDETLDEGKLEQTLHEKVQEEHQALKQLQFHSKMSAWMQQLPAINPNKINWADVAHQYQEYRRRCKNVLLELWKTIHPDQIQNHPAYAQLTQQQRDYLTALSKDILSIKMDESDTMSAPHVRLEKLEEKLEVVKKILTHAGIDVNVSLIIQGETIAQQIAWLEKEIVRYKNDIEAIQIQLVTLSQNPEMLDQQRILETPDAYEDIRNKLVQKTQEYQDMVAQLEKKIADLLAQRKQA